MKSSTFRSGATMLAVATVCQTAPIFVQSAYGNVSIRGFASGGIAGYDLRLSLKHDGLRVNMNLGRQVYGYSSNSRAYAIKGSAVTKDETYNLYDYRRQSEQTIPASKRARHQAQPVLEDRSIKRSNDEFLVEPLSGNLLRLTRRVDGGTVQEIELFLADAQQKVLAAQTLSVAPFTATFNVVPGTAYAGHNIVWADGTKSTLFSPYRPFSSPGR
jgi:hypothetical protein